MTNSLALKLSGLLAVSVACMAASGGCGTQLHKAAVSSGAIAASLNTAATTNHNDTLETPAEKAQVAAYILKAAAANNAFIGDLSAAESSGSTSVPAKAITDFQAFVTSVNALQTDGLLGIKSAAAQAEFTTVMAAIQAQIVYIESLVGTASPTSSLTPHVSDPLRRHVTAVAAAGGLIGAAGVTFTPAEIDELISLAIAAASTLVPKLVALKGESDATILSNAAADDAAAIQTASEDAGGAPAPAVPAVPETAGEAGEEVAEETEPAS